MAGIKLRPVLAVSFVAWTFVAGFYLALSLRREHVPLAEIIALLESVWLWVLFSPVIVVIAGRLPLERQQWLRNVALHVLFAVLFAMVDAAIDTPVHQALGLGHLGFAAIVLREAHVNVFSYFAVAVASYAAIYYRTAALHRARAAELERQYLAARLDALTAKLRPHFFFNALNTIAALIRFEERDEALAAICNLGDLLRDTFAVGGDEHISLAKELSWVERYLEFENIRYEERLAVEVLATEDARQAMVPALLLQPLVENAIQHGVERRVGNSRVRIEAQRENGELWLEVRDSGDMPYGDDDARGFGLGLDATRERLVHIFGEGRFAVDLNVSATDSVAQVRIPYRAAP